MNLIIFVAASRNIINLTLTIPIPMSTSSMLLNFSKMLSASIHFPINRSKRNSSFVLISMPLLMTSLPSSKNSTGREIRADKAKIHQLWKRRTSVALQEHQIKADRPSKLNNSFTKKPKRNWKNLTKWNTNIAMAWKKRILRNNFWIISSSRKWEENFKIAIIGLLGAQ